MTLTSEKAFLASVGRILGWDIVVGQERFFSAPLWWVFKDVERSSLLVNSVELIKEFGFLNYFVQFGESTALRNNVCRVQEAIVRTESASEAPIDPLSAMARRLPVGRFSYKRSFSVIPLCSFYSSASIQIQIFLAIPRHSSYLP